MADNVSSKNKIQDNITTNTISVSLPKSNMVALSI